MKRIFLFSLLWLFCSGYAFSQEKKYSTFYYQRTTLFEVLPVDSEDIIFLGNSITNGCEWSELFADSRVKNRGISGDITMGVYDRLDPILEGKPAKIFLLIGINDVARGISTDSIVHNIGRIVDKIGKESPDTRLYLQSLLPVTDHYKLFEGHTSRGQMVPQINEQLKQLAAREQITYIDLYPRLVDPSTGQLNIAYTNDGLHLLGKGYLIWRDFVKPYIDEK